MIILKKKILTVKSYCSIGTFIKSGGPLHTAPESVKRVKSIEQILVMNKMEAERLSQCWQKTLPKKFKPSWMPVKNGVLWWPELPPNAFVAFNLQKNDLPTIFFRCFLHVRSSVIKDSKKLPSLSVFSVYVNEQHYIKHTWVIRPTLIAIFSLGLL